MPIFFHLTPTTNVKSILARGLIPRAGGGLEALGEVREPSIFLATSTADAIENLEFARDVIDDPDIRLPRRWTLLRVSIPYTPTLLEDQSGLLFTVEPIRPEFITISRDIDLKRLLQRQQLPLTEIEDLLEDPVD